MSIVRVRFVRPNDWSSSTWRDALCTVRYYYDGGWMRGIIVNAFIVHDMSLGIDADARVCARVCVSVRMCPCV